MKRWGCYSAVVLAEIQTNRYNSSPGILLMSNANQDWALEMSPAHARAIARKLKQTADFLDPPKTRKRAS